MYTDLGIAAGGTTQTKIIASWYGNIVNTTFPRYHGVRYGMAYTKCQSRNRTCRHTGLTGYSWNRKLIPEPEKLIKDFKDDHIYVVLNEHPHDGIRPHEDSYQAFVRDLGVDTQQTGVPLFDAGDRDYMNAFMKHAHQEK